MDVVVAGVLKIPGLVLMVYENWGGTAQELNEAESVDRERAIHRWIGDFKKVDEPGHAFLVMDAGYHVKFCVWRGVLDGPSLVNHVWPCWII